MLSQWNAHVILKVCNSHGLARSKWHKIFRSASPIPLSVLFRETAREELLCFETSEHLARELELGSRVCVLLVFFVRRFGPNPLFVMRMVVRIRAPLSPVFVLTSLTLVLNALLSRRPNQQF